MFTRYVLPLLAIAGVLFAGVFVAIGNKQLPAAAPIAQPAQPPFAAYIAGAGLIESSTENIAVGTVVPGVVQDVRVKIGDNVKAGQPLFKIDDRDLQADLLVKHAAVTSAQAKVKVDQTALDDVQNQLDRWQALNDPRAVSKDELDRKRFAVQIQQAKLDQSKAELASAEAQVKATQTEIDRRIVRAPVDGQILQAKIRVGEFAPTGVTQTPLMLIGNVSTMHVRVDVDENDAWRLNRSAKARAYLKGNKNLSTELNFVGVEPYVIPKRSLTGDSSERVDTRVLQVIYAFDASALPVYVGQQMDVYIDAPPVSSAANAARNEVTQR